MPGFLSWISGFFSNPQSASPAPEPRLFNPAHGQSGDEDTETGTLLARQLEENLFCWLLDVPPSALEGDLSSANDAIIELQHRLSSGRMEELPRQPLSLPMLLRALADDTTDRQRLTDIILGDPALTDQLLQMANSPYFRHGDQAIDSVDQAVFLLGLDGIRNVVSAAVMRPMMAARNSREALFAQRVWRWGLTCARASELTARAQNADPSAHFMAGLLPALAYITIRRELHRICRAHLNCDPDPALIRHSLVQHQWATSQLLALEWSLPPQFNALLLSAERPAPRQAHTPLIDGMILGTREVLRHAHQRNLADEDLPKVLRLEPEQIDQVRHSLKAVLQESGRSTARV